MDGSTKERYRYYYLMRPPAPGCQPERGLVEVKAFDRRTYIEEIAHGAWGWCEYSRALTTDEADDFELEPAGNIYR